MGPLWLVVVGEGGGEGRAAEGTARVPVPHCLAQALDVVAMAAAEA